MGDGEGNNDTMTFFPLPYVVWRGLVFYLFMSIYRIHPFLHSASVRLPLIPTKSHEKDVGDAIGSASIGALHHRHHPFFITSQVNPLLSTRARTHAVATVRKKTNRPPTSHRPWPVRRRPPHTTSTPRRFGPHIILSVHRVRLPPRSLGLHTVRAASRRFRSLPTVQDCS
ncbi:hypothetical protein BJ875DRAFT_171847 [Amylocarpus encephaloides]|uniref:Uncharacterized protein n=1 Tax=Amylocarpus encephaloides TaxID=45428 RepID=A0A9P7YBD8_9HELO|nr:hypothetical protein BJ875DRAFT_171847 [Amylocarpus encephaloides]